MFQQARKIKKDYKPERYFKHNKHKGERSGL